MRILFIWDADYPWDIRVEKVCNSLIEQSHEIHLVCRNQKYRNRSEIYNGINLHRLKCLPKPLRKLNSLFSFPFFLSPVWLLEMYRQAKKHLCEVIIVRDLPMAPAAILIGKILKLPVILDMAECYPELLRCTWKFEGLKLQNILARNPIIADLIEHFVIKNCNDILVMIEESRDRLLKKQVDETKIHIVSNTPVVHRFIAIENNNESLQINNDGLRLVYVGLLNPSRGIDTVLMAIIEYVKSGKSIKLIIAGSGKDEYRLKKIVRSNNLDKYVMFLGWVDNSKVPHLISEGDICIVPHHKCTHWETTIPNKLFDYMAAGKPVLVTNVSPMVRIVNQSNCGLSYEDYNAVELAAKFSLLENSELRKEMGNNAKTAISSKYRWDIDEKILVDVVAKYHRSNS